MLQQAPGLYFAASDIHGRGVFCAHALKKGDLIEICPVIVLPQEEIDMLTRSHLNGYYFAWGAAMDHAAIALGFGSLYNHAIEPNAEFVPDYSDATIEFTALKDIPAGEEITVDYHAGAPHIKLWFTPLQD